MQQQADKAAYVGIDAGFWHLPDNNSVALHCYWNSQLSSYPLNLETELRQEEAKMGVKLGFVGSALTSIKHYTNFYNKVSNKYTGCLQQNGLMNGAVVSLLKHFRGPKVQFMYIDELPLLHVKSYVRYGLTTLCSGFTAESQ